jgi:hypothetical protein
VATGDIGWNFAHNSKMCRVITITARTVLAIVGVVGASVMSTPAFALSHEEWVMAFVRFVEWPVPPADKLLLICQPANAPTLDLQGKQVRGLTLQVIRINKPRDADRCHVFAALSQREAEWLPWLNALKLQPILAVGVGARFCELGGTICVVKHEALGSETYQLNLDSLSRSGFKVRSQLLRPAPGGAVSLN